MPVSHTTHWLRAAIDRLLLEQRTVPSATLPELIDPGDFEGDTEQLAELVSTVSDQDNDQEKEKPPVVVDDHEWPEPKPEPKPEEPAPVVEEEKPAPAVPPTPVETDDRVTEPAPPKTPPPVEQAPPAPPVAEEPAPKPIKAPPVVPDPVPPTELSESVSTVTQPVEPSVTGRYAVGTGFGRPTQVNVYHPTTHHLIGIINPFGQHHTGGARVATGDVTGDGVEDIIVAAGPGGLPIVKVFDGVSLREIRSFMAYDQNFQGGVYVSVGDVTGDGRADIITGAGLGGGPHVQVFSGKAVFPGGDVFATVEPFPVRSFYAYAEQFRGGVTVGVGDVNGDGRADIITGAGPGGGPHVRAFSGVNNGELLSFYAYDPAFRGGVFVAVGNIDEQGSAIVTGLGAGGNSIVKVFDKDRERLAFEAWADSDPRGARVGVIDLHERGRGVLLIANGPGGAPMAKITDANGITVRSFPAMMPDYTSGLYVG